MTLPLAARRSLASRKALPPAGLVALVARLLVAPVDRLLVAPVDRPPAGPVVRPDQARTSRCVTSRSVSETGPLFGSWAMSDRLMMPAR